MFDFETAGFVLAQFTDSPGTAPATYATYRPPQVMHDYKASVWSGGVQVGPAISCYSRDGSGNVNIPAPTQAGTYTVRIYKADGTSLVSESAAFSVGVVLAALLYGLPTIGVVGSVFSGGSFTLLNAASSGITAYAGLWNTAINAYQGSLQALMGASGDLPQFTPLSAATYVVRVCADSAGAVVLATSPTIAVTVPAETGSLFSMPTSGTAGSALASGGAFSLTNAPTSGTTAYVGLFNVTSGVFQDALQALTQTSGSLPPLTPSSAATYVVKLCANSSGSIVLATSQQITVIAAPSSGSLPADGTLAGIPSTIGAGQPLSSASPVNGVPSHYYVLYNVAAAAEEGSRWTDTVWPDATLRLFIPQNAGSYTIRAFDALTGGNLTYESGQFTVTAASGALPGTPTQTADTNVVSGGVTMNWTATAPSYHVLGRPGVGARYGSLVNATVATNSYTFSGVAANSFPRATVIPQNSSGFGTPSVQFLSGAGA